MTNFMTFSNLSSVTELGPINHDYNLFVKGATQNCYKFSSFVRTVNKWIDLPKEVVHAGSLTIFRNRLKIHMNIN